MKLTASTILITGGANGIGLALAQHLLERGNRVIVCGRSEETLAKAKAQAPALITRVCDIADTASRRSMVDWLNTQYPDLSILINNAGVQYVRDFTSGDAIKALETEVAVNFTAPIQLIAEMLPSLRTLPQATIVNVTSGLAFSPKADVPVYCATKAALHSFTLSLRHQLKGTGIKVVEMAPPIVDTGLGGGTRAAGVSARPMMSSEQFASEALAQLENDQDEVLVGMSADSRRLGEAMFERMNNH